VLLVAHRVLERTARAIGSTADDSDARIRALDAADLVCQLAMAEQREMLLVLPVGRGTASQRSFVDALERQARVHQLRAPRQVKAGLLAALLSGEGGDTRWIVATVMTMADVSAVACEAIGDTGPWPVVSIGRDACFYDMPASGDADDPLPMLLAVSALLEREGHAESAQALIGAVSITLAAAARMREELGTDMPVPREAFLRGLLANWGRTPIDAPVATRTAVSAPPARLPSPPDVRSAAPQKLHRTVA
jgi:hypothetical protein